MTTRSRIGVGLVLAAFPAAVGAFFLGAAVGCHPDGCYGGPSPGLPIALFLGILIVALSVGVWLVASGSRHEEPSERRSTTVSIESGVARTRVSREEGSGGLPSTVGQILWVAAIPAAIVTGMIIAARYCPSSGCSGDYSLALAQAFGVALLTAIALFIIGGVARGAGGRAPSRTSPVASFLRGTLAGGVLGLLLTTALLRDWGLSPLTDHRFVLGHLVGAAVGFLFGWRASLSESEDPSEASSLRSALLGTLAGGLLGALVTGGLLGYLEGSLSDYRFVLGQFLGAGVAFLLGRRARARWQLRESPGGGEPAPAAGQPS